MTVEAKKCTQKKMPKGSISLLFAGDLILAKCDEPEYRGLFRRYEAIFENLANMEKSDRLLKYRFLNALMLTSYAKKETNREEKRKLFDLKNKVFLSIATDRELRRKVQFHYLVSKNFRVIEYCPSCVEANTKNNLDRHSWKYCKQCKVDRNFYNIVAMTHKFSEGSICIFLSNDQATHLGPIKFKVKGRLGDMKEEAMLGNYHYNVKNLDAIKFESVIKMFEKVTSK